MGVVYRAHDPEIDRQVAIKLIRADLLDGAERVDYVSRFRREAQAAGRCTHPNIVTIYDFATHEGNPFLAMEFVRGFSLAQGGTPRSVSETIFLILQVLDALAAAHAMGVVHRDIKPANILLTDGQRVKVTDFGISRFANSEMTQEGASIGTPAYMSPEQCRGEVADARSDLFSTGVVFYELLSGRRAFGGGNFMEVTRRVLREEPPDLAAHGIAVPPLVRDVLMRALAKDAVDRFAHAADMAASLRAALPDLVADDYTLVAPRQAAAPPHAGGSSSGTQAEFDATVLQSLERRLAHHVGPIARLLVQTAARESNDLATLRATLAGSIARKEDRDAFCRDLAAPRDELGSGTGGSGVGGSGSVALGRGSASGAGSGGSASGPGVAGQAASLDDAELLRAQQELARHLGPIASVHVKREAADAATPRELWQRLALHIDDPAARQVFLSSAPAR
jgi:hypothetical protein